MNTVYSETLKVTAHVVSLVILSQVRRAGGPLHEVSAGEGAGGRPLWPSAAPFIAVGV